MEGALSLAKQPVTSGLLAGSAIDMHVIAKKGNDTAPLLSIKEMRQNRMVVDFEEDKVMFKDKPGEWHKLPRTKKGLLLLPITKKAVKKHEKVMHVLHEAGPESLTKIENSKKEDTPQCSRCRDCFIKDLKEVLATADTKKEDRE